MSTDYKKYSDVQLLKSYQKGDEQAGNILFQRYGVRLYRFFKKRIRGNNEDIEDLVQETFCEALKSLKMIQSPKSFPAWLYKIAKRVLGRWIKEKQKQGVQVALDTTPEDELGQISPTELFPAPAMDQPDHEVLDAELGDIRLRFESTLRPEELTVFRLRQNSSMKFKEIGQALGIESNAAKVQYHRVVTKFKAWLEKRYPDIYDSLYLRFTQRRKCVIE